MRPGGVTRFAVGQAQWLELATIDGFVAQFGGWARDAERTAVIVAIWRDRPSYDSFMRLHHDRLASAAEQSDTYAALTVELVEDVPAVDVEGLQRALTIERNADGSVHAVAAGARAAAPRSEVVAIEPRWTVVAAHHQLGVADDGVEPVVADPSLPDRAPRMTRLPSGSATRPTRSPHG